MIVKISFPEGLLKTILSYFSRSFDILYFPKIISPDWFGNSYIRFDMLDMMFCFICGKSNLFLNVANLKKSYNLSYSLSQLV